LRWARLVVLDEPSDASPVRATISARVLLAVAAAVVLLFGLVPAPLISAAQRAAEVLQSS